MLIAPIGVIRVLVVVWVRLIQVVGALVWKHSVNPDLTIITSSYTFLHGFLAIISAPIFSRLVTILSLSRRRSIPGNVSIWFGGSSTISRIIRPISLADRIVSVQCIAFVRTVVIYEVWSVSKSSNFHILHCGSRSRLCSPQQFFAGKVSRVLDLHHILLWIIRRSKSWHRTFSLLESLTRIETGLGHLAQRFLTLQSN